MMGRKSRTKGQVGSQRFCGCGCGEPVSVTAQGKLQRYVWGHNGRKSPWLMYRIVQKRYETPCWLWQGGNDGKGYGRLSYRGRLYPAHLWFYEQERGPVPSGLQLDHLCRNPGCVNPDHLEPVTNAENVRRSTVTPLTDHDVAKILAARVEALAADPLTDAGLPRQRVKGGVELRRQLGERYGVSPDTIKHIWSGYTWA